jgi:hypothetical protein
MVYAELSMRAGAYPEEVVRLTVRFGSRCNRASTVEILCCHESQMLGMAELLLSCCDVHQEEEPLSSGVATSIRHTHRRRKVASVQHTHQIQRCRGLDRDNDHHRDRRRYGLHHDLLLSEAKAQG